MYVKFACHCTSTTFCFRYFIEILIQVWFPNFWRNISKKFEKTLQSREFTHFWRGQKALPDLRISRNKPLRGTNPFIRRLLLPIYIRHIYFNKICRYQQFSGKQISLSFYFVDAGELLASLMLKFDFGSNSRESAISRVCGSTRSPKMAPST